MARLGAGIVADVVDVHVEGGAVICVSPKLGGALVTDVRAAPARLRRRDRPPERLCRGARRRGRARSCRSRSRPKTYAAHDRERRRGRRRRAGARGSAGRHCRRPRARRTGTLRHVVEATRPCARRRRRRIASGGRCRMGAVQLADRANRQDGDAEVCTSPSASRAPSSTKSACASSGTIVAINKDAAAPIAEFSDLLVVGDAFRIVPELTKMIEAC